MSRFNFTQAFDEADEALWKSENFFVYGSLQRGQGNSSVFGKGRFVQSDKTQGLFALGDVGVPYAFPEKIVPSEYNHLLYPVRGEMWEVTDPSDVMSLDFLEGHPDHYRRQIVRLASGEEAWMYMVDHWSWASRCDACHLVEGEWRWKKD